MRTPNLAYGLLVALAVGAAAPAAAQDAQPSAEDRLAAAQAYDRASAAFLQGNFAQAAQLFEMAHRLAPSSTALLQAVIANRRANSLLEAANLALRLEADYGDEPEPARIAAEVLTEAAPRLVRVRVECEACAISVDGSLQPHPELFLAPQTEHVISAEFDTGAVERTVAGRAGEERTVRFERPAPRIAPDPMVDAPAEEPAGGGGSLHPAFAIAGAGLTAVAAGLAIWSGVDTLSGVDAFNAMPTRAAWEDGHAKEIRTDVLIGVTAGLAAVTIALAVATVITSTGGEQPPAEVALVPLPDGGAIVAEGRF